MVKPTFPRIIGTIAAIEHGLTHNGLVLRYRTDSTDDGLPGAEGVFLACSFWLVDALVDTGRRPAAAELFEKLLAMRNDVGLLSEEWDSNSHSQLGNTPQAFSHFALINSARKLDDTRRQ
jgi:GH15 family glucan-1,4-alpha-glucosidase